MKEIKKIAKSTVAYLFGNVGSKLITLFLMPVLTENIPEADFGVYNANCSYATLIASILFLDIWSGIMRYMFDYKEKNDQYKVIYSGLIIFVSSMVLYAGVFVVFNQFVPMEYMWLVWLYGASICVQNLYSYISRAFGFNTLFAVSGILSTLVNAGVIFVMIFWLHSDYKALYIAYAVGILIQCIMLECKVHLFTRFRAGGISRNLVRQIFRFSLPLCINSACYWMLTGFNTIYVMAKLGEAQTGYYGMAGKFAVMLNLVTSCFSMAWQELAFTKSDGSQETGKFYSTATNLYMKALFCGYILLIPMISVIFPFFVRGSYGPVKEIIPFYMLAAIASALSTFLGNILTAYKRNNMIFLSTLAACLVNVAVAYFTIDFWGVQAASIAMFCGYLVCDLLRIRMIRGSIDFRLDGKVLLYMVPAIALVSFAYLKGNLWSDLGLFIVGCAAALLLFRDYVRLAFQKIKQKRLSKNQA